MICSRSAMLIRLLRHVLRSSWPSLPLPHFAFSFLLLASLDALAPVRAQPAPTLENLFGPQFLSYADLSPDGTRLLGAASWRDDVGSLVLINLATLKPTGISGHENFDVFRVHWHGDERILFSVTKDKLYSWGLWSAPPDKLDRQSVLKRYDVVQLVGQPRARPRNALVWVRASALDHGAPSTLQEIDTLHTASISSASGEEIPTPSSLSASVRVSYPVPPGDSLGYTADFDGEPAFAYRWSAGSRIYSVWDASARDWRNPPPGRETLLPLAADPDGAHAWVVTRDTTEGSQLRRMSLASGELGPPVLTDTTFDLRDADLIFSRVTRSLVGVRYERQRAHTRWFAPKFEEIQKTIDARLPREEDHRIVDFDEAETRFLVRSTGPRQPGLYHLYDLAKSELLPIGETLPSVTGKALRPTSPITFKARDGLALGGYLTTPAGLSKTNPAPLVVLPHGGPAARDSWAFDPEVQFLASLGYAVLQPNYRGSTGHLWPEEADDYETAFAAMRDDVIDATRTALKSGLFDPRRVAIMGGSFGGYLSLACSVEEPDLYRCAVSVCGVFDWAEHVNSKRDSAYTRPGEYQYLLQKLGDPRRDQTAYEAINPLSRLDRLRTPFLIAHGKEDKVASIRQSRLLVKGLKERGIPHETFYRPLAGHGFYAAKDRLAYYQTLHRFLAQHLAPPAPAP